MEEERTLKIKMGLLGDPAVGKTSLIRRYVIDRFDDRYISTIGSKVTKKNIHLKLKDKKINMTLMIWDMLGQSDFKNVLTGAISGMKGAMIVCDLTRKETLEHMEDWIHQLYSNAGPQPMVLLANKSDLEADYQFGEEEVKALADYYKAPYFITSAKTGDHVDESFMAIAREMALVHIGVKKLKLPEAMDGEGRPSRPNISVDDIENFTDLVDYIIARFCTVMGGQDFAMPIIRQQFKIAGLDPQDPALDEIESVMDALVKIVRDFKGDEQSEDINQDFVDALNKVKR